MRYHGLSGGEIVTQIYRLFEPRTPGALDKSMDINCEELPRLYCSGCMQHSTIFLRDEKHTDAGSNVIKPWYCRSCRSWFRRPKQLMRRGDVSGTQTRSTKGSYELTDFEANRVLTAIDLMRSPLRSWTLWVHTDGKVMHLQPIIVNEAIIAIDNAELKPEKYSDGVKLYFFAEQLALNERMRMRTSGERTKYTVEHMATGLEVGVRQLRSGKRWGIIRDIIEDCYRNLESEMDTIVINALESAARPKEAVNG